MALYGMLKGKGPTGFGFVSTAEEVTAGLDLSGRTYLVTGCNSGLGAETLRVLSLRGATVVCAARTIDKAEAAAATVSGPTVPVACELAEPESVLAAVQAVRALDTPLDGIICNAGIMALPSLQQAHGYELQFFTNHVGHFILVTGLLEALAPRGRVVVVSSEGHRLTVSGGIQLDNLSGERGYDTWRNYGQAKLANILFATELARRLEGTDQTSNAVHPGVIVTNLGRHMHSALRTGLQVLGPAFTKTVPQGAATQCYVGVHPDAAGTSGRYWADSNVKKPSNHAQDRALARALWDKTEAIVAEVT
jgi:WW domain-containing oxidoreductase